MTARTGNGKCNHRSFDYASRGEAARGFAQDDRFVGEFQIHHIRFECLWNDCYCFDLNQAILPEEGLDSCERAGWWMILVDVGVSDGA